jgi:uncharacterized protein YecE (DUF72 family)
MIRLGTSGFSYDDWVGSFYPPELPKRDWLAYYAREFDTVELNVTYYRIPEARTVAGWIERAPPGFLFAVKAFGGLTHERKDPDFAAFVEAIEPLREAGKLGCILAQFPYSFAPNPGNWAYLQRLREGLDDHRVVVEFRQQGWVQPSTFERLRVLDLGFCCVDEPKLEGLMPPEARATASVAYVRFHGRNARKWWEHEQAWERYDYTYPEAELKEWIPRLSALEREAEVVLVYANNHYRGQSVDTLRALRAMLAEGTQPLAAQGGPRGRMV